ncbi:hypothetical protein GBP13_01445 [Pediococcus acidilactici]|nr:hypothetical protein GBO50_01445 [Pediococcus acidilactici]KAF0369427.1 hypothetical protein GBO55_01450 [Pediococcus acidilactici]KAF0419558.1 hypothetical protein GBO80_02680 [Pediococcus acidilactici]KAF0423885.1 hypothetical protein GBO82_03460 [Pediococcus acidilactici]KAF0475089.1 hypothetical protein GBP08_01445 [Pediococcus acidilactici]
MKASLRFNRFSMRGIDKVTKETGIVIVALNIMKLVTLVTNQRKQLHKQKDKKSKIRFFVFFIYCKRQFCHILTLGCLL